MAVRCSKCGTELLGAVNACWNCGQAVLSHSGGSDAPPVGPPPEIPVDEQPEPVSAIVVDDAPPAAGDELGASPFAETVAADLVGHRGLKRFRPQTPATVAAYLALLVGISACAMSYWSAWALVPAVIGIPLALWGLRSRHRTAAGVGLGLCLLCMSYLAYAGIVAYRQSLQPTDTFIE